MSDAIIVAVVGGIFSLIVIWMQNRQATKIAKIVKSQAALEVNQTNLHKQINSRMDELLELTRKQSKAEGKAEEKADNLKINLENPK